MRLLLIFELVPKELMNSFAAFEVLSPYYFFFFFNFEIRKFAEARVFDVDSLGLSLLDLFKYLYIIISNFLLLKIHICSKCMDIFNPRTSTSDKLINHDQTESLINTLGCRLILKKRLMTIIYKWLEGFYTFTWSALSLRIFESLCLYTAILRSLYREPSQLLIRFNFFLLL